MAERFKIYKCELCGNIVEVLHEGDGELVCCGQPMELYKEKTADSTIEKHVPIIKKTDDGYKVTVGINLHPMVEDHYIEWIELTADGKSCKQYLKPGDDPVAYFYLKANTVVAREYCNKHGLWRTEK